VSFLPPDWNLIAGYPLAFAACKAILAFAYSAYAFGDLLLSLTKLGLFPNATAYAVPTFSLVGEAIWFLGDLFPPELSYYCCIAYRRGEGSRRPNGLGF